jgi:hypothetical protein
MMTDTPSNRGGARAGAGRKRNRFVEELVAAKGVSRATIYRRMRNGERLSEKAMEFAADPAHTRQITHRALDVAGWFNDTELQVEVLKLAIELRLRREAVTHCKALIHLRERGLI